MLKQGIHKYAYIYILLNIYFIFLYVCMGAYVSHICAGACKGRHSKTGVADGCESPSLGNKLWFSAKAPRVLKH